MRAFTAGVALVGLGCLMVLALGGCGGGMQSLNGGALMPTAFQSFFLVPFVDGVSQTPRYLDIADNPYAAAFRTTFAYPAGTVQMGFNDLGALQFTVTAPRRALKPNFCYQMKIEGPAKAWANDISNADFVNYSLGSNGRWWDDTAGKALTDADIASGSCLGHYVKGYLYFDFLVTKGDGSVSATVPVKSSYHVTWKSTQRPRTASDGPLRSFSVAPSVDRWAYDKKRAAKTIKLYGEWEPGRAAPGTVSLPAGAYGGVEFRLTEESFHSTSTYGGNWRTVMNAALPPFTVQ